MQAWPGLLLDSSNIHLSQIYQMSWGSAEATKMTHSPHPLKKKKKKRQKKEKGGGTFWFSLLWKKFPNTARCNPFGENCERLWDMRNKRSKGNNFSSTPSPWWLLRLLVTFKRSKLTSEAKRIGGASYEECTNEAHEKQVKQYTGSRWGHTIGQTERKERCGPLKKVSCAAEINSG